MEKAREETMTVPEVAALKEVAESAVRLAIITGRIKGKKRGRDWMVERASAEAWVPQRRGPKRSGAPVRRSEGQEELPGGSMSRLLEGDATVAAARRAALIAYLESGETDAAARAQLEALPGGKEMLARALEIRAALAPLAGTGASVDQYLEWKREEIEAERQRDERRHVERP